MNESIKKNGGTFKLNKAEPIHSWYSYVEGYSSCLVESQLKELSNENLNEIYDPFAGAGTTPLVACQNNIQAYYSESNPFMCNVIDTKINVTRRIIKNTEKIESLVQFKESLFNLKTQLSLSPIEWNGFEKFFDSQNLKEVLLIKDKINTVKDSDSKKLLMLVLSSILVESSLMFRRGDLRYATDKELEKKPTNILRIFTDKLDKVIADIKSSGHSIYCNAIRLSEDARDIDIENKIDCVITSPPYLNGTNYIRNTKLELKLNNFIESESDLPLFHSKGIVAGINNVSRRNQKLDVLPEVQPFIELLTPVAYDSRIVSMVSGYFNDMNTVIERLHHAVKDNGIFIMDIGDSQFAGIHIPTHDILSQLCENWGFIKYDEIILRERRSKNGMVLSQRLLKFRLKKESSCENNFEIAAKQFVQKMPYKEEPYNARNWGHKWHSLCSYHGKLKPSISYFLIDSFTKKGDVVLDPLSGVGTIPFEACLQGRVGIGNDLSKLAYVVSKAKLEMPKYEEALGELKLLEKYIQDNKNSDIVDALKLRYSSFGYNGKLSDYFEDETYSEILCAREYFKTKPEISSSCAVVYSSLLHVLHGNRPYALSRTSHPLTPYAPKGEFIYKNVVEHVRNKINMSYKNLDFSKYIRGEAIFGDFTEINKKESVDAIICSPPFADSIRFYMQNWMRLWLCGWEEEDFKIADILFLDVKQKKDFSIYSSFFKMCYDVLKSNGKVILHLGKTDKIDMAEILSNYSTPYFKEIYRGSEGVSDIEKHGIKDKGVTIEHQFLFLMKR